MYCIKLNSKYVREFMRDYYLKPMSNYHVSGNYYSGGRYNNIILTPLEPYAKIISNFGLEKPDSKYEKTARGKIISLTNKTNLVWLFESKEQAEKEIKDIILKCENIISQLKIFQENVKDEQIIDILKQGKASYINKFLFDSRSEIIDYFEQGLKDLHKLKVVEFSPGICFSGNARKIRHAIQKKNTIANKTICSQCQVIIPTKEFFTIDSGSSGRTLNVCPFCIVRMAEEARKIQEKFTKDNPKLFDEYETQLVLRNL